MLTNIAETVLKLPRRDCMFDYQGNGYRARLAHLHNRAAGELPFALVIQSDTELFTEEFPSKNSAIQVAAYEIEKRGIGGLLQSNIDGEPYFFFNGNEITSDTPDAVEDDRLGAW